MKESKVIILGGTGSVGQPLADSFRMREIETLSLSSRELNLTDVGSVKLLQGLLEYSSILIFAAAKTREKGDTAENMAANIKMAQNVAECLRHNRIKTCIYLSTADVYGIPGKFPLTENSLKDPLTYYARGKSTSEDILVANIGSTPLLILRYPGVFGPGQKNIGYGPSAFVRSIKENNAVVIWGNGAEKRDFLYIKDLVELIILLSLGQETGIFNLATGETHSFNEVILILAKILPKKFKVIAKARTGTCFDQVFDNSKLRSALPNFKFHNLEQALLETYRSPE